MVRSKEPEFFFRIFWNRVQLEFDTNDIRHLLFNNDNDFHLHYTDVPCYINPHSKVDYMTGEFTQIPLPLVFLGWDRLPAFPLHANRQMVSASPLFPHQRPICWVYFPSCATLCSLGFLFGGFLGMFPPNSGTSRRYGVHQNRPDNPDQRLRHDGSARYFFDDKEEYEHDGLERRTLRQVEKTTRFG